MSKIEKYNNCYDRIHVIYAYEFHEYKACYVGRTKELKKRHKSHCVGKKHSDGKITYDSVYSFSKEKNIPIPEPLIKEENLTAEESLIKEDFWVNEYKNNGWVILNKAKTGLKSGSLGHVKCWAYETCKEECKKYKTKSELKKYSVGCYEVCLKNGWIDEFILKKGKRPNGYWKIKENVINESKKYKTISDFINNSIGAYKSAKENGWINELNFDKKSREITFNEIWGYYQQCGNIKNVMKKYHISYKKIKKMLDDNGVKTWDHNRKDPEPHQYKEIQNLLDNGISMREIERTYNICRKRIPKIFNLEKWKKTRQR